MTPRACRHVIVYALALSFLMPASVSAEGAPLMWKSHRRVADWISWGLVSVTVSIDAFTVLRSPQKKQAILCELTRVGITSVAAHTVKKAVRRVRPDGSNDQSFYSEHTAFASLSAGWNPKIGVPMAAATGYLRMAAGKHYASDVATGAAAGWATEKVCDWEWSWGRR